MFKSIKNSLGKVLARSKTSKVVKTKSGSSTFTKYKSNGKTKWVKSGGTGSFKHRKKK